MCAAKVCGSFQASRAISFAEHMFSCSLTSLHHIVGHLYLGPVLPGNWILLGFNFLFWNLERSSFFVSEAKCSLVWAMFVW